VPAVAKRTRVCVHQRAGTGSSPPVGHSRTAAVVATELGRLLDAGHIERPVVLVGASFGGYVVRLCASREPQDVSGVSPKGELVVAERSHHRIAEDQPELVSRAIEHVLDEAASR
jgi:hypothetical protein